MNGLSVNSLNVRLGKTPAITDATFTIPSRAITAVVGPNGAGKSTLLRCLAGTVPASSGSAIWEEHNLLDKRRRYRARLLAFVEQDAHTDEPLSVRGIVELGRTPHRPIFQFGTDTDADAEHISAAMAITGVTELADRQYSTLSGGQRQRVHLARALAQQPQLLFLDEPTNHLDPKAQLATLSLIQNLASNGITVVAALHDLSHAAAYSDHVVVLHEGQIYASGAPDHVLTPPLIRAVYDVEADLLRHPKTAQPVITLSMTEDRSQHKQTWPVDQPRA